MSAFHTFAINGRFLTQNMTGVQRYAFNVVNAMTGVSGERSIPTVVAPASAPEIETLNASILRKAKLSGHAWEQLSLPRAWPDTLLNLCNTAPLTKRNQVICIHDANIFTTPESYSAKFKAYYRTVQPFVARRAMRVATVSQASARQISRHLQIPLGDIAVLPNGHEHALLWDPAKAEIAPDLVQRICEGNGRRFILALGSRSRHKNLDLLVRAAPELDRLGLDVVIAGGGAGIFEENKLDAHPNVHLLGRVSDADLACLLDSALCLAFPSLTEGFGLPIVEAMARGCPVVSSNLASMPEVCGHAALMASPFDPKPWVAHIEALSTSPDMRLELVEKGRQQVMKFTWSETADGYRDLMETSTVTAATRRAVAESQRLKVGVIFATRGRPVVSAQTLRHLLRTQTLKPDTVIVSCVETSDAGDLAGLDGVRVITGPGGLPAQRNTGLAALPDDIDVVVFFDDDFIADDDWLRVACEAFQDEKQVACFTGRVVADGIKGPGISYADAVRILEEDPGAPPLWTEPFSPYGCNMAFRMAAVADQTFDERLVLYGWLEDRDFGAAVAKSGGQMVKYDLARGVHMGTKSGRVSGLKLGYSQIVNPIYLMSKGTMTFRQVAGQIFRNVASNLALSLRPEPFIDRRGRVKGNVLAVMDLMKGRLDPERAATLTPSKTPVAVSGVEKQS
ncbi:glycosyltransferase family 4 protein [Rhodobacterales bacterium]|nr:glycosyltransferase family 4 protein [Rhodobacterales bacterium]